MASLASTMSNISTVPRPGSLSTGTIPVFPNPGSWPAYKI